ncbi:hypothetical protein Tco_1026763 [Tanacetum coccineum]
MINSLVLLEVFVLSAEPDEGKHYNRKASTNKEGPPEVWREEWHQYDGERYKNDKKEGPVVGINVIVLFLVICASNLPDKGILVLLEVFVLSAEPDEGKHYNRKASTNKEGPPEVWREEWHQCDGERYKNDKKEGPVVGINVIVLFLVICASNLPDKGMYI